MGASTLAAVARRLNCLTKSEARTCARLSLKKASRLNPRGGCQSGQAWCWL